MSLLCSLPALFLVTTVAFPQAPGRVIQPQPKTCAVPLLRVPVPLDIDPGIELPVAWPAPCLLLSNTPSVFESDSSEESVGEFRLGQLAK